MGVLPLNVTWHFFLADFNFFTLSWSFSLFDYDMSWWESFLVISNSFLYLNIHCFPKISYYFTREIFHALNFYFLPYMYTDAVNIWCFNGDPKYLCCLHSF
jgi:hypothetical protein